MDTQIISNKENKNSRPLVLIYYECYTTEQDAKQRELYLKGGKGHGEFKIQLKDTLKHFKYKNL